MQDNLHLNSIMFRPKAGEKKKRMFASGRKSPRELFGNLKLLKSFKEEDATMSRDSCNAKTSLVWKPPLKTDLNECSNTCPSYYDNNRYMFNRNLQESEFTENAKSTITGLNENFILNEDINEESDDESITGNSEETVLYGEHSVQKKKSNVENHNFQKEIEHHDISLDNSLNDDNSMKMNYTGTEKISSQHFNEHTNVILNPLIGNQEMSGINNDFLIVNTNNLQDTEPSIKDQFTESIYDSIDSQHHDSNRVCTENLTKYEDVRTYLESNENNECSDNSFSSKSTIEINEGPIKLITNQNNTTNKTLQSEIKQDGFQEQIYQRENVSHESQPIKNEIDDLFDLAVTNSQFSQLEKQMETTSNHNQSKTTENLKLNNNLETFQRCTTSLRVQTEWQNNILRSMIKEIDELNKTVINATASLKSVRRSYTIPK